MLWDERKPSHAALMPAESVMASVGRCGIRGSSLPAFGVSGERLKSRHRYCIIKQSEFEEAGGLAVGVKRRASIFRFRSAHRGKSFGIAADAEMPNVLSGV